MYFWDLVRLLLRRWYVVLPIVLLTALAAYAAITAEATSYRSTGSVILVAPPQIGDDGKPRPTNAFRAFDGSMNLLARALTQVMDDEDVSKRLEIQGTTDFSVSNGEEGPSPFVYISGSGRTPQAARASVLHVADMLDAKITALQEDVGAPPDLWVRARVLAPPSAATEELGGKLRKLTAVTGLGLAIAVGGAVLVDALLALPARRAQRAAADGASPDGTLEMVVVEEAANGTDTPPTTRTRPRLEKVE